jgi:DNA-binding CsgD family transcriptional regulator
MAVTAITQGFGRTNQSSRGVRLTPTEVRVLSLIAQGHSSKEAADRLVVSKRTVDFHLANIYDKLQVSNRVQAIRAATRLGLLPSDLHNSYPASN